MNARSTETLHVIIIGSAGGQDTLDSLRQDLPETGIVPLSCPDPGALAHVLRPLSAGTRVLLLRAGDRVEPGYLASLTQHGSGDAVGTLLTPTVTIRPDGARDDRLQWRFKHGNRSTDLTVEPHIFPDTVSGAVLTIPRHGLQDWGGPGALHAGDRAVGAQTAADDEHTALSGLIAHIMATAPLHLRYWVSKFVPLVGIVTATNLIVATMVLVADPHHDLQLYALTLAGTSTAAVTSVGVGMVCAAGTIVLHDPFRLANIVTAVFPLSAGVLLPHATYPAGIREVCAVLPGTWLVAALRENAPALMLVECGVSALWLVLGLALLMVAGQLRYRSGRTDLL